MTTLRISDKGQITLPAKLRRSLRLEPRSRVTVEVREDGILLRPETTARELEGILRLPADRRKLSWDEEREIMERAVAEEVAGE
jgi:AbrB family looped-hinge helix DNA binding protein